jgi:hypothetical protein
MGSLSGFIGTFSSFNPASHNESAQRYLENRDRLQSAFSRLDGTNPAAQGFYEKLEEQKFSGAALARAPKP